MTSRGGRLRALAVAAPMAATASLVACSSSDDGASKTGAASCPNVTPAACGQAPSYARDIGPIFQRVCVSCHSPGGVEAQKDLTTYAHVARIETTVIQQLNGCLMPPADAPTALTPDERARVLQWFVCGAPNN